MSMVLASDATQEQFDRLRFAKVYNVRFGNRIGGNVQQHQYQEHVNMAHR